MEMSNDGVDSQADLARQPGTVKVAELEEGSEHVYRLRDKPAHTVDRPPEAGFFVHLVQSLGLVKDKGEASPLVASARQAGKTSSGLPDYSAIDADRRAKVMRNTKRAAITFGTIFCFSFGGLCLVYFSRHGISDSHPQANPESGQQSVMSGAGPAGPAGSNPAAGSVAPAVDGNSGAMPAAQAPAVMPVSAGSPAPAGYAQSGGLESDLPMLSPGLPPESRYGNPRDGFRGGQPEVVTGGVQPGMTDNAKSKLPEGSGAAMPVASDELRAGAPSPYSMPAYAPAPAASPLQQYGAQPVQQSAASYPISAESRRLRVSASEPSHRYRVFVAR